MSAPADIAEQSSPGRPERAPRIWRTKWRWVAAFWFIQGVVLHVAWACTFWIDGFPGSWSEMFERVASGELFIVTGFLAGIVTLCQAVMLLPVRRPRKTTDSLGMKLLHGGLCAATVAAFSWLLLWPVSALLHSFDLGVDSLPDINGWTSLILPAAVGLITFVTLWMRGRTGVPVLLSVFIAATAAALLLAGLLGGIASLIRIITGERSEAAFWMMAAGFLVGWAMFTPLLLAFVRRRGVESALARVSSRLFLGTIVEAAAIIPLDVMVRRKTNCYCEEGTFWTLTFCWAVGTMSLGPVMFLVPLSGRRKRWYAGRCEACGYDMSGCMNADRCPECGAGWKAAKADESPDSPQGHRGEAKR